ncbi:hypothetical protein LOAG_05974 [Loa loa]|uniref:Uncharacterized protein n=1 Tax=Loa loa TaxID=7209 RepID=A0A1S0TYW6_LOALO|nr:hypothetical protein LOAG_05974 [Loa loa]EFO22516.1 hypothetical protein LOAG_05974 [Loa loa]
MKSLAEPSRTNAPRETREMWKTFTSVHMQIIFRPVSCSNIARSFRNAKVGSYLYALDFAMLIEFASQPFDPKTIVHINLTIHKRQFKSIKLQANWKGSVLK